MGASISELKQNLRRGDDKKSKNGTMNGTLMAVGAVAVSLVGFCASRYKVAGANERLVRTGFMIDGVDISQKCFQWPFQTLRLLNMQPTTYFVPIEAMSKESISFHMPTVWTIAPKRDPASQKLFCERLIDMDHKQLERFYSGVIAGDGRIIAGTMGLEEFQSKRDDVRSQFVKAVGPELNRVGAEILNVNIADLGDAPGQEYFAERRKRALSAASNTARVAVAEAQQDGDVGVAKFEAETREKKAQYERQATLVENTQQQEIWKSRAELAAKEFEAQLKIAVAKATQQAESERKESEMQKVVEEARQQQQVARQRALELSATLVTAEKQVAEASGAAQATIKKAEGEAISIERLALARRVGEEQKAQGVRALLGAQATGLKELVDAAGGSVSLLNNYLLVQQGALDTLMKHSAEAFKGMKPVVTVSNWNRSSSTQNNQKEKEPLVELMSLMPKVAQEMERVTGISLLPQLFSSQKTQQIKAQESETVA